MTTWDPALRLVTVEEAAASVGRHPSRIRHWARDGLITARATLGRAKLYLESDVLDAERYYRGRTAKQSGEKGCAQ